MHGLFGNIWAGVEATFGTFLCTPCPNIVTDSHFSVFILGNDSIFKSMRSLNRDRIQRRAVKKKQINFSTNLLYTVYNRHSAGDIRDLIACTNSKNVIGTCTKKSPRSQPRNCSIDKLLVPLTKVDIYKSLNYNAPYEYPRVYRKILLEVA